MIRNQKVHEMIAKSDYLREMYNKDNFLRMAAEMSSSDVEFVESLVKSMRGALAMAHDVIMNNPPFIFMHPPNAKDQPDHGIKYLRVGAVANTLCHGLGCIQLLGSDLIELNSEL